MWATLLAGGLSRMWPQGVWPQGAWPFCGWPFGTRPAHGQAPAPGLLDFASGALARMIEGSRERAIAAGVRAIPPGVQRALLGFFPASLLQRVRYRVVTDQEGLLLPQLAFDSGHADAMTLGDVILFRREHTAQTDLVLWAHELTHVMQYQRWGTDGFAARYLRDHDAVEREARENAARFRTWQRGR